MTCGFVCVSFRCPVIPQVTLIKNDTTSPWVLVPVINNDYWKPSTPSVTIAPGATGEWTVLYRPLTLTSAGGAGGAAAAAAAAAAGGKKVPPTPSGKGTFLSFLRRGWCCLH